MGEPPVSDYKQRIKTLTQGEIDALIGVYGKKVVRGWFPMHKDKINCSTARKVLRGKRFC